MNLTPAANLDFDTLLKSINLEIDDYLQRIADLQLTITQLEEKLLQCIRFESDLKVLQQVFLGKSSVDLK